MVMLFEQKKNNGPELTIKAETKCCAHLIFLLSIQYCIFIIIFK